MTNISKEDLSVWDSYITKLYNTPEYQFVPKKAQMDEPDTLDLHGMTVQQAFNKTNSFLRRHYDLRNKMVTIITGKDGKINEEFPHWCNNLPFINEIEPLIDSRGQCGAYLIILKRIK